MCASGVVSTFVGGGGLSGAAAAGYVNGAGTVAKFNTPGSLCLSTSGTMFVTDRLNNVIRRITSTGK